MIHYDMTNGQYHGTSGISKTGLDLIAVSPAHYYAQRLDPNRPSQKARAGQEDGTLIHCAILEPSEFDKRYVVGPDCRRGTKQWKEFEDANRGKVVIKREQRDMAFRCAESARQIKEIDNILETGHPEVSAFWQDQETGMECKCRPDWVMTVPGDRCIILDVKSYSTANAAAFAGQMRRKRYHVQDAFYTDGFEQATGLDVVAFVFLAVEVDWPHAAAGMMLDDESKQLGREMYREDLNTYAECVNLGVWPGYPNEIQIVSITGGNNG
jgi:hypothetical protein